MTCNRLAQAYAFLGNSLLSPISETGTYGLDVELWDRLRALDDREVSEAVDAMVAFLERHAGHDVSELVRECSVEHAWLFVGPPRPHVYPWETLARSGGAGPAFGLPARCLAELMREDGLVLAQANRQAEDHLGVELLYLSVLSERMARCLEEDDSRGAERAAGRLRVLLDGHILGWIGAFVQQVCQERPDGYYAPLVRVAQTLVEKHRSLLV